MRTLPRLVERRRALVEDTVHVSDRLTDALTQDFPQVLDGFKDRNTPLFCDFLTRWPPLTQAQPARQTRLTACSRAHTLRHPQRIEQRVPAILRATPLTSDAAVSIPNRVWVEGLVEPWRAVLQAVARFDRELAPRAVTRPDDALCSTLPGAGPVSAPRLLAAFGDPRERYPHAAAVQKYLAIAPVTERRGHKCWGRWRWPCPTCRRQPCVEWAAQSLPHAYRARACYATQRAKGSAHQAARRALAFQGIRIL